MAERALKCPQCNAPLAASRFARSAVCPFCGSTVVFGEQTVPASRFRAAFQSWNSPESHGFTDWISLGDGHWARGPLVARGEVSDVHASARARWPTERALLKILRDPRDAPGFDHEWEVLARLQESAAAAAASFAGRIPQPIARGRITAGASEGSQAMVFTAGALLLSERRVSDLRELEAVLLGSGMPADRRGAVARTLKPLAEAQGIRGGGGFWRFWS